MTGIELYDTLMKIIKGRRSIRRFKSDPVPDDYIEKILEAARLAPSWANTQCWRFIIVKDQNIKNNLAETAGKNNPAYTGIKEAPVVIVAVAKKSVSGFYKEKQMTEKEDWYMFDVALALDHLTLAAHTLGLGTVHVGLVDHKKIEELLNIKEGYTAVEIIPVGFPGESPKAPARKPLSELIYYEKM